jgi:hypothetical protein
VVEMFSESDRFTDNWSKGVLNFFFGDLNHVPLRYKIRALPVYNVLHTIRILDSENCFYSSV